MNELKKIQYNCRKATYLIEKQLIDRITAREKLELRIHLVTCSICRTFQRQSLVINQMVRSLFDSNNTAALKLDKEYKKKLQKQIDDLLDKN